jgi:hypothetical protein
MTFSAPRRRKRNPLKLSKTHKNGAFRATIGENQRRRSKVAENRGQKLRAGTTAEGREKATRKKSCRSLLAPSKPQFRSKLTNQGTLLPEVDGRSALARRFRDIVAQLAADQGGADRLSEARLQLLRRFAAAAVLAEELEGKLARGQTIDLAEHALLSSTLVRIAQRIGIDRRAKTIPSLNEYLASKQKEYADPD